MGREIRRVLPNWEHPKYEDCGRYIPLMSDYKESLNYYKEQVEDFIKEINECSNHEEKIIIYKNFMEEEVYPPNIEFYMPNGEWYQLYENVSEGTPISPPFEKEDELINWLVSNRDFNGVQWCLEGAKNIIKTGYCPSGAFVNGKVYRAEEMYKLQQENEASDNE